MVCFKIVDKESSHLREQFLQAFYIVNIQKRDGMKNLETEYPEYEKLRNWKARKARKSKPPNFTTLYLY